MSDTPMIEQVSAQVHENWMAAKRAAGVTTRLLESGEELMVPYDQLSEAAKELDRGTVRTVLAVLPDEFHGWVREVAGRLHATVEQHATAVEAAYSAILAGLPPDYSRKDFALVAKEHQHARYLFARHDGKDYRPALWTAAYPAGRMGPRGISPSEDTA